jgi:PAS domain S-box-containing protein
MAESSTPDPMAAEIADLRARLAEAEDTLRAIREGEVDALLVSDESGERVFTLRSADAPYRALVEQMREGAATLSTTGIVMYCNRRFADLLGLPLEQVIGMPMEQFVQLPDQQFLAAFIRDGAGMLQTRLLRDGQPDIEAQISVSAVVLDQVAQRTVIVSDISSLTRAQQESRSKDEFLAMLAHELRNPLGAIQGAVQVLQLPTTAAPLASRATAIIQRQVIHMARLVDDLLDVGRVVMGKIVLSSVAAVTAARSAEDRVRITVEPVWIYGDPVRVEQIIGNLVSNALKFTQPEQLVHVSVTTEAGDAVLTVTDEGAGIERELLPRIFDLFVQAQDSIDRSKGGLGIGLTLVRRLVELHGGQVEAFSKGEGHGASFTVRMPAVPAGRSPHAEPYQFTAREAHRVLLVDDNADSREMYRVVLRTQGHHIFEADNGRDALALLATARPDVAFIDIGLPGIDGYELARQIRKLPGGRDVTLIALTGYGFPEDRERSHAAGFDRHLVKPVAPADLQKEIADVSASGQ